MILLDQAPSHTPDGKDESREIRCAQKDCPLPAAWRVVALVPGRRYSLDPVIPVGLPFSVCGIHRREIRIEDYLRGHVLEDARVGIAALCWRLFRMPCSRAMHDFARARTTFVPREYDTLGDVAAVAQAEPYVLGRGP